MLNTYIKNRGITKTIIHNNDINNINQIKWDADYDGDIANIHIDSNTNGKHDHFNISLNNDDLANILNIKGVNMPIHKRLEMDFKKPSMVNYDDYFIELPLIELKPKEPILKEPDTSSIKQILDKQILSPKTSEELIIPLTIDKKTADNYTITPRRRHRRHKTHITHRVFRRPKSAKSRSRTTKTKTNRVKSLPVLELL
jgi:hypothetical protein